MSHRSRAAARAAAPALLPAAVLGGGLLLSLVMVLHALTMY
ncbi:hypothetical protein [Rhodovarius crocodyli]|jgi:hypothetical protein|nr:hypothetical protein [Rhodovarius crocodyli]